MYQSSPRLSLRFQEDIIEEEHDNELERRVQKGTTQIGRLVDSKRYM